jgi:hypothetical protein
LRVDPSGAVNVLGPTGGGDTARPASQEQGPRPGNSG